MARLSRSVSPGPEYNDDQDRTCRECKGPLKSLRQSRFCSHEHSRLFWNKRSWPGVKYLVHVRDDWTCRECGVRYPNNRTLLHGDHIVPIADGGDELDLDNVRTLCVPCHKAVTKAWHKERAERNISTQTTLERPRTLLETD